MEARYIGSFEPDFPRGDVEALGMELVDGDILAPGFIPPAAGLLNLGAIVHAKDQQGYDTVFLPDRNLVSRMARVARDGHAELKDKTSRIALALMAYSQAMGLDFEPSVAFHELGAKSGNAVANEELSWFRAADKAAARDWIALAAGRRDRVHLGSPSPLKAYNFAFPLHRWRRNYVVALKVARLELEGQASPRERAIAMLDWMYDDFFFTGPSAAFATMYFGPKAAKRGLFKRLRAPEAREEAIAGIRNAAWDMTYLSDFVLRVSRAEAERRRYIFASADFSLVRIARTLLLQPEASDGWPSLGQALAEWWTTKDAQVVADAMFERVKRLQAVNRPLPNPNARDIDAMIAEGEAWIRDWRPQNSSSLSKADLVRGTDISDSGHE